MLRKIRIILASIFFIGVTLLFLDFTGTLHAWLGWMAKIQFLPAVLAANVLVVNNYRDMDDDMAVGKRTTVVIFGRKAMGLYYLVSGMAAMVLVLPFLWKFSPLSTVAERVPSLIPPSA